MRPPSATPRRIFLLFATTIFLSALLLFWIELALAKILLPRLGGTPAVWTTCMFFFQVLLLAGYSWVLATTSWIGTRKQAVLHGALLLLSSIYLPLTFAGNSGSISEQNFPALWLFGYLVTAIGLPVFLTEIVLGDARLQLQNAPDHHYGLIVLDAFNSDAIPVHLLTQEAIELYMSKLATGGMLAFHISNRSLRLDGVLANLAKHNGAMSLSFADGEYDPVRGKDPSEWLVMARQSAAFDNLSQNPQWRMVQVRAESDLWTDDFSNILRVFRWWY